MASLRHSMGLQKGGVISLVGGGGKTALMFRLARELSACGDRVLTTTSTKIRVPMLRQSSPVLALSAIDRFLRRARAVLKQTSHITAGRQVLHFQNKLEGFHPRTIDRIWQSGVFRWIIVEADGAAGKPLKAPAAHEPVIPSSTRWVVGVVGLTVVGKPLNSEWVFRPQLVSNLTGLATDDTIDVPAIVELCVHKHGLMKSAPDQAGRFVFLNHADSEKCFLGGQKIARLLMSSAGKDEINGVLIGQTIYEPTVEKYYIID